MQSNFATILPQHADVSESASSAHGILGRHGLMGTMIEAVLSTQCIQQVTCTRSMNWRDGVLSRRRARWTASTNLRMQWAPGCPFEIGWRRHTVTSERVGGPELTTSRVSKAVSGRSKSERDRARRA